MKDILRKLPTRNLVEIVENFFNRSVYSDFVYTYTDRGDWSFIAALREWCVELIADEMDNEIENYIKENFKTEQL